jgi:4-oxalocrotonate tautomerase
MPLITVTYSSSRQSASLKSDIAAAVSELTAKILHKDPKVTAIIVKSVDAADWFAGGKSLAEQKLASYWLDIHVSEGTNTKDEKAAYLAAMFKRMGELLGPLHNESYLHVDEVKGDAYGFGGLSQERRYIAGKLEVPPQRQAARLPSNDRLRQGSLRGTKDVLERLPERDVDVRQSDGMAEIDQRCHAKAGVGDPAGYDRGEVRQIRFDID